MPPQAEMRDCDKRGWPLAQMAFKWPAADGLPLCHSTVAEMTLAMPSGESQHMGRLMRTINSFLCGKGSEGGRADTFFIYEFLTTYISFKTPYR